MNAKEALKQVFTVQPERKKTTSCQVNIFFDPDVHERLLKAAEKWNMDRQTFIRKLFELYEFTEVK